jgi:two-component system LytT family response regulator
MKTIRTIIVEDEPVAVDVLKQLATALAPDININGIASDGITGMRMISELKPDLIFLDIDMPLLNGLDIIEKLSPKDAAIVFTTGSEAHALRAIKLDAVDYLLKPIDPADFVLAVDKVRSFLQRIKEPADTMVAKRLQLPTQHGILYIEEDNIMQVTGMGSYSQIITIDKNEKIVISRNIGHIEQLLSNQFFRCHNSHIINLKYVKSFSTKDGYFVMLKDNSMIEVSRRSKDKLLAALAVS